MHVLVMSMVANSIETLPRYREQLIHLRKALSFRNDMLTALVCEGDSVDGSWRWLEDNMPPWVGLTQCHHGGKIYTSQVNPVRFAQLSKVWNHMFDLVALKTHVDVVVLIEDDLIWQSEDIIGLIDGQRTYGGVVCPMVYMGPIFYDTWAYRRNGRNFHNWPRPFHPDLEDEFSALTLDSAGSCLVMSHEIAATCRTTPEDELVGFCGDVRQHGYEIRLLPRYAIDHPVRSPVVKQRFERGRPIREAARRVPAKLQSLQL